MPKQSDSEVSLFGYYVRAAHVAATLGVSLGYAFDRYVKPNMPDDESITPFTDEEAAAIRSVRVEPPL